MKESSAHTNALLFDTEPEVDPLTVESKVNKSEHNNGMPEWSEESFAIEQYAEGTPLTLNRSPRPDLSMLSPLETSPRKYFHKPNMIVLCCVITIATVIFSIFILKSNIFHFASTRRNSNNGLTTLKDSITTWTSSRLSKVYEVGKGGVSGDPPCSSYTAVDDPSRSIAAFGSGGICDQGPLFNTSIGGRWIRFVGSGGTKIPSMSPGISHCGAFLPGWFDGKLPTAIGATTTGRVCFETPAHICGFKIPVSVVYCDNFYVYFLSPMTLCNGRYCTV